MHDYLRFRQKLYVTLAAVAFAIGCASFPATVKKIGDETYEAVRTATNTANAMVANGTMTDTERRTFAKNVTVPVLTILDETITVTLAWRPGEPIPAQIGSLISQLAESADNIRGLYGSDSQLHKDLIRARLAANEFLEAVQ